MTTSPRLQVHLGGLEETHPLEINEPKTVAALLQLIVASGRLPGATTGEVYLFEEDSDDELPPDLVINREHLSKRFHAHRCRHVKVTFIHVDEKREHAFRPGATIAKLLHWAKQHFTVDKSGKYTLRLTAEGEPLPHAAHIGSYVKPGECDVTLYFAPACRIQG